MKGALSRGARDLQWVLPGMQFSLDTHHTIKVVNGLEEDYRVQQNSPKEDKYIARAYHNAMWQKPIVEIKLCPAPSYSVI